MSVNKLSDLAFLKDLIGTPPKPEEASLAELMKLPVPAGEAPPIVPSGSSRTVSHNPVFGDRLPTPDGVYDPVVDMANDIAKQNAQSKSIKAGLKFAGAEIGAKPEMLDDVLEFAADTPPEQRAATTSGIAKSVSKDTQETTVSTASSPSAAAILTDIDPGKYISESGELLEDVTEKALERLKEEKPEDPEKAGVPQVFTHKDNGEQKILTSDDDYFYLESPDDPTADHLVTKDTLTEEEADQVAKDVLKNKISSAAAEEGVEVNEQALDMVADNLIMLFRADIIVESTLDQFSNVDDEDAMTMRQIIFEMLKKENDETIAADAQTRDKKVAEKSSEEEVEAGEETEAEAEAEVETDAEVEAEAGEETEAEAEAEVETDAEVEAEDEDDAAAEEEAEAETDTTTTTTTSTTTAIETDEETVEATEAEDTGEEQAETSTRTRRPRGSGGAGLQERADEFRAMAADLREQAKSETGHRADNLNARADRADAAADRMEAAAARAGGGSSDAAASADPADPAEAASETTPEADGTTPADATDTTATASAAAEAAAEEEEDATPNAGGMVPATSMQSSGYWSATKVDGEDVMVWNPQSASGAEQSNYGSPDESEALTFQFKPATDGEHRITLEGTRIDSAVNGDELAKHQGTAKGIHHLGNDVYLQVRDLDTGNLVMQPEKFVLRINDNGGVLTTNGGVDTHNGLAPATVDLKSGGNYQVEILGRSDGFALAGAAVTPTASA